ncbi:hypothetical protein [Streptomyces sp. NBC_01565]|uniref:hypothetical protein n=1 Tax=unclassified Streptomyces TaxID=2593676 RepID=UPI002253B114|nr:hypothetical protein [Streptomyces sp. NBC_01565]MCX4545908.1 hypothetical protein [Streptomyces sp. NBC_01565]
MISVSPAVWRSAAPGRRQAVVIAAEPYAGLLRIEPTGRHAGQRVLPARRGTSPAALLAEAGPDADVLVLSRDEAVLAPDPAELGPGTAVAAARLGAGADDAEGIRRVLRGLAQDRPAEQRLLDVLDAAGTLTLTEALTGARAALRGAATARRLFTPGAVRPVPPLWLALDTAASLGVPYGRVTVKGAPAVAGAAPGGHGAVRRRLAPLASYPLVLDVRNGRAAPLRAVKAGSDLAAAALAELFADHPGLDAVTGTAFGAASGSAGPGLHLVFGGPGDRIRLALPCATTTVRSRDGGPVLAGPPPKRPAHHRPTREDRYPNSIQETAT